MFEFFSQWRIDIGNYFTKLEYPFDKTNSQQKVLSEPFSEQSTPK